MMGLWFRALRVQLPGDNLGAKNHPDFSIWDLRPADLVSGPAGLVSGHRNSGFHSAHGRLGGRKHGQILQR